MPIKNPTPVANLQGRTASQLFEVKADEYEENRHFLLGQYFKQNYNKVMSKLPAITAPIQILRLEVWVTNRNGTTTETRDVVGLMDLGESGGTCCRYTIKRQQPVIYNHHFRSGKQKPIIGF
ncbi:MAG: hypothetical protein IPO01_09430 [Chitinophagaceae bacterium]|nr:hypothetical protein [Chitinophagaceae bacterium]